MIDISFIIPVLHFNHLKETLISILEQDLLCSIEVIVVKNFFDKKYEGKFQETLKDFPDLVKVQCNQRGASAARNKGASVAKGRILAFIDSDALLPRNWLTNLSEQLDNGFSVASCSILPAATDRSALLDYRIDKKKRSSEISSLADIESYNNNLPFVNTCCMLVKADVFFKLGGFEEDLLRFEDTIFSLKLFNHKANFYFDATLIAKTYFDLGVLSYILKVYTDGREETRLRRALIKNILKSLILPRKVFHLPLYLTVYFSRLIGGLSGLFYPKNSILNRSSITGDKFCQVKNNFIFDRKIFKLGEGFQLSYIVKKEACYLVFKKNHNKGYILKGRKEDMNFYIESSDIFKLKRMLISGALKREKNV